MKKPFLLIAGDYYYPYSHTGDWKGCFETYDEALNQIEEEMYSGEKYYKIKTEKKEDDLGYGWYDIIDLREWAE
jgi:hypothetical protein